MLEGKVTEKGVVIPGSPLIVDTVLEELKKEHIIFHETIELKAKF
jgi:hypothetical protein